MPTVVLHGWNKSVSAGRNNPCLDVATDIPEFHQGHICQGKN